MAMEEIRMARMSKEEQARREGMAYALRFAREKGIGCLGSRPENEKCHRPTFKGIKGRLRQIQ